MINFRKVFTIRVFSLTLCVLLLCETAAFAYPVPRTLRVPVGEENTYVRINGTQRINALIIQAQNLVTIAIATTGITDLNVYLVGSLARGHLEEDETINTVDIDIYVGGPTRNPKVRKLEDTLYFLAAKMGLDVDVLTYDTIFNVDYLPPEYLVFGQAEGARSMEESIQGIKQIKLEKEKIVLYRAKKADKLASNQDLRGPFRVTGTDILCYLDETSDQDKIRETLEKWFSNGIDRFFRRGQWKVLMRLHPDGYLAKLETAEGRVLGLAFVRKVRNFMFSMNERTGEEDISPVYFLDQMEITNEYRNLGLGEILMAKVTEKALNDTDIKDRLLVTEPATRGPHSANNFFDKIGGIPINIINEQIDPGSLDDKTEWQNRHYVFYRASCENILNRARSRFVPTQLSLFEDLPIKKLASNETSQTNKVFSTLEITDKSGNKYYIEKVDPADYIPYARELLRICQEQMALLKNVQDINGIFGISMFYGLHHSFIEDTENPEYKKPLALFILKDKLNKIIGARIFYEPKEVVGVESEIITGLDAIRFEYQDLWLGTKLRAVTLGWLKEKGYHRYAARVQSNNERSLESLKRVALELNATVSTTIDPELYILELPGVAEAVSMPGFTQEAINSSL